MSEVFLIQRTGFLELLKRQPELALRMLSAMSAHLRVLVSQLDDLTLKDVETRLTHWILKRCPDPGSDSPTTLALSMTKRALAAEIGTVSETLSRTLAKLRSQKLIEVHSKSIRVVSQAKLKALMERRMGGI
jgi:CRP/FNR family transcriptional regulator